MIQPAATDVGQVDAADGVLEIRRPDAEGVDRQREARPPAQRPRYQCDGAGDFAQSGDEDDLRRERHPGWRDCEQLFRRPEMRNSGGGVERRQDPAHDRADFIVR